MDSWPNQPKRNDQTSSVSKEKKRTAFSFPVAVNCDFIDSLFLKFSSFTKIIDIFAFSFRYITNCKARVGKMKNLDSKRYRATTSKQLMGNLPTHRVGEIVIIKKDNIPPEIWPLGKLIETHPGKDGVLPVVKTNYKHCQRAYSRLDDFEHGCLDEIRKPGWSYRATIHPNAPFGSACAKMPATMFVGN
ncbi:hypothetical protein TNCV_5043961 [Trichonephila clavipes]|uniref:DUF5641 domain-containing protein n=1 Tax=Trichonephila clavipes TaxID=2585209 RepID=A0A8X6WHT0_TRICX|nr:hypothetical protein TNCV_5043961 [Trichonephila clavipes]